jgi:choline-sulfatase
MAHEPCNSGNNIVIAQRGNAGLSRREFLAGATMSGAAIATGLTPDVSNAAPAKEGAPNVLFLMSDEHAPNALHCNSNRLIRTPALDALAKTGLLFTSAYCQNPICVPSRASLITGIMPSHVNVFGNNGGLNEKTTLATVFQASGYTTEWLGKEHWGGDPGFGSANDAVKEEQKTRCTDANAFRKKIGRLPQDAEVADYPVDDKLDSVTTEHALRFLENHGDKPFFLGVSYKNPHFPFGIQQYYYELYKDVMDSPRVTTTMLNDLCEISRKERDKFELSTLTDTQTRMARAMYYGMVTYIDDQIGKILNKLDQLGLRENTIIVYTSDHGELAGEHGLWYKNSFYESSVSVPFIWSFPKRLPTKTRINAHVMNMDIFPTLCELCEIPVPNNLEGSSLLPLMMGKEDGKKRIALSENYRGGVAGRMIRMDRWKYCWYSKGSAQLYDLVDNPAEERNLIANPHYADLIVDLKNRALSGFLEFPRKQKN